MGDQSDIAVICKPKLSKLSVVALFSSMLCVEAGLVVFGDMPFGGRQSWLRRVLLYYFDTVQSIVESLLGSHGHNVRDLSIQIAVPGIVIGSVAIVMVLGFVSTIRIDRSERRLKGVSLCMTAIGISLVTLHFTSHLMVENFREAWTLYKRIVLENHRRQYHHEIFVIGEALNRYAAVHGSYPRSDKWSEILVKRQFLKDKDRLLLLAGRKKWCCSLNPDCDYDSPGDTVLLFESDTGWNLCGYGEKFVMKHEAVKGRGGYIFLKNGELKFVTGDMLSQMKW